MPKGIYIRKIGVRKLTEKTKLKISKALKGNKNNLGRILSKETRRKISKAHLSISDTQETKIIELYKTLTADEISHKLNLSRDVVYSCLYRYKIQMRPMGIRMGKIPWNKDLEFSEEQKAKLNMEGLKLGLGWNKGKIGHCSEGTLRKMRESHVGKFGSKSSNWQGGISFEPYSPEFNKDLKEQIRKRDNFTCQMPKCGIKENGRNHSVHHLDYDKENTNKNNLITLCVACNSIANGNRPYWKKLFQNIQIQRGVN